MKKQKSGAMTRRQSLVGLSFVALWIIGFLLFFAGPMLSSLLYSFQNVQVGADGLNTPWAGLEHYYRAFFVDTSFLQKLADVFVNLAYEVPIIIIFSLFIAVMINQKFWGRGLVRTVFFLPLMLSSSVLMAIISGEAATQSLTQTQSLYFSSNLSITDILIQMGLPQTVNTYIMEIIDRIFDMTWRSSVQILLFLSALQSISPALYEAASVEGANAWETFWKITTPMIGPIILVNIVYTLIDSFTSYSNGLMQYILAETEELRYSYSSAMAWIYCLAILICIGIVIGLVSRKLFYYAKPGGAK